MKVLYIVGVGRSGSTLLERMLGAVPGSVNAGELNAIFSRVATQDQRCGCGEPFSACPSGRPSASVPSAAGPSVTRRMADLQPRVVRQRHVPQLVTGLAGAAYRRELDEYLDVHHRLYRAVAAVSGAEVVVDASKSTAQLFALRRIDGLDLRVLNLVRDSRGVAHSWNKAGIDKPQSTDGDAMGTYAPHRLAMLWATLQLESAFLARGRPARHPGPLRGPGRPPPPHARASPARRRPAAGRRRARPRAASGSVTLGASHGVAGQPHPVHRGPHRAAARRRVALDAVARGPAGWSPP